MRRIITPAALVASFALAASLSCSAPGRAEPPGQPAVEAVPEPAAYRVALVTWAGGEGQARAVERLAKRYRLSADGGLLLHSPGPGLPAPGASASAAESLAAAVEALAADEAVKAVVLSPGPKGAAAAVAAAKALRPGLLCYVAFPEEEPIVIQASGADLVIGAAPGSEPVAYPLTAGLVDFAKAAVDGLAARDSLESLAAEMRAYVPEHTVRLDHYVDAETRVRAKNHALATIAPR